MDEIMMKLLDDNCDDSTATTSTKSTSFLNGNGSVDGEDKCNVCLLNKHKYKCPRCSMKTCSLECCKKHKLDNDCSGQREKTKFVSKDEFDESTLINDYRFLEEQARIIDSAHRDPLIQRTAPAGSCFSQNSFFDNLRKFVYGSFGICLKYMPPESTRHKLNRTKFNRNNKTVSWSIEFVFHANDERMVKVFSKNNLFQSNQSLKLLLVKFFKCYSRLIFESNDNHQSNNKVNRQRLESNEIEQILVIFSDFKDNFKVNLCSDHISTNDHKEAAEEEEKEKEEDQVEDLNVLMEKVNQYDKKKQFVRLDLNKSLNELLRNHTIIEFPTLFVVRSKDLSRYDIRESSVESSIKYSDESKSSEESPKNQDDQLESASSSSSSSSSINGGESCSLKRSHSNENDHLNERASKSIKTSDPIPIQATKIIPDDYELEEGEELD